MLIYLFCYCFLWVHIWKQGYIQDFPKEEYENSIPHYSGSVTTQVPASSLNSPCTLIRVSGDFKTLKELKIPPPFPFISRVFPLPSSCFCSLPHLRLSSSCLGVTWRPDSGSGDVLGHSTSLCSWRTKQGSGSSWSCHCPHAQLSPALLQSWSSSSASPAPWTTTSQQQQARGRGGNGRRRGRGSASEYPSVSTHACQVFQWIQKSLDLE